ncbi:MAG: penicillin-binding protein [Gorillibacterium sp.]|nr:penicillin-binding protein [Gorillibacterium sp.]
MSQNNNAKLSSPLKKSWLRKTGKALWFTMKWTIGVLLIGGFLVAGTAFGYVASILKDEPVRSHETIIQKVQDNAETGYVYFNDDSVIGQLRTDEDRTLATFEEIPQKMRDAVLAIEDKDFGKHNGVDTTGTLRAIKQQVLNEEVQTGGSTITQQLSRIVFLNKDRELSRKIKEIFLSLRLERHLSKEQILTAYLNKIPYGNGSSGYNLYGIKSAAKGIFNIDDLNKLNIAQCAYLAGVPQQPSNFSSFTSKGLRDNGNIKNAIKRQQLVLNSMLKEEKIISTEYDEAIAFDIQKSLAKTKDKAYNTYPFLMIEAEKKATELLVSVSHPELNKVKTPELYEEALKEEETNLLRGGYKVYTTIDKKIYDSMQSISKNKENFTPTDPVKGIEQVGAVLINNKSGAILGMIEGRGFRDEQYNHAMQAQRQPGSTMKPIAAYLPALDKGAIQPASVIDDIPIILKDYQKGFHIPENWNHKFHGLVTARVALNNSYNIPAIKLFLNDVGIEAAWTFAKELGITTITESDYSAQTGVIGGLAHGVTVEELANAYASIPNQGVFVDAHMIRKITDVEGTIVFEQPVKPKRVYSEQTAYLMTDMLHSVITSGTGSTIKKTFKHYNEIAVSGKTGSTQDDGDAWFMGYTPDITLGVWVGYDDQKFKLESLDAKNRAKNIWSIVMDTVMDKKPNLFPNKEFEKPKNIVKMTVSSLSGLLPSEEVKKAGKLTTDLFNSKYLPVKEDDVLVPIRSVTYNKINYIAKPETPDEFVEEKLGILRKESISELIKKIGELMLKLPASQRKSLDRYIPLDADKDAPQEIDPRTDDGKDPAAPANLILTGNSTAGVLTFKASLSPDIVGYRIYRAADYQTYQLVSDTVVLAGAPTAFKLPAPGSLASYYITAVDVAGRESTPSAIALPNGMGLPPSGGEITPDPGTISPTPGGSGSEVSPLPSETNLAIPAAPVLLDAKKKNFGIQLKWQSNAEVDQVTTYKIYYANLPEDPYEFVADTLETDITYMKESGSFYITAVNRNGESSPSQIVTVN